MTHSWWQMCSPRRRPGRSTEECDQDNSLCNKQNVNEEYLEAFRTKSYIEICNKAQVQLGRTISSTKTTRSLLPSSNNSPATPNSSNSNSLPFCKHLTEQLLEPRQETITQMKENMKVHHLLVDYFEASLEACHCCDTILEGVHSIRLSYRRITRIFNLSKRAFDCECEDHKNCNYDQQAQRDMIYRELASFALLQNKPLSLISNVQFHDIHDKYMELLQRLRSKRGKIRRRLTFKSICKKVLAIALVASHSAILIALLVFSFHSIVGLVAAPSIVGGLIGLFMKRRRIKGSSGHKISYCERLCEQLDVAAKGVYILINDLDTMSRMVKRLHDEVEHRKVIADVCVRNYGRCDEIMREVVREFGDNESSFLDQLDELEEHIYLCFLTINRSRRLLVKEIAERNKSI